MSELNNALNKLDAPLNQMSTYGDQLIRMGEESKGTQVKELAEKLLQKKADFQNSYLPLRHEDNSISSFIEKFKNELHLQDDYMQTHRQIWKPIIANIFIALTGVGLLFQIAKAASGINNEAKQGKRPTFNNCLFFGKTHTQECIEAIDLEISKCTLG